MIDSRIQDRKEKIRNRRQPVQERSRQRAAEILKTTARLLEQVGFDDLTTILIAKELGISVGSLYHYFPNKQAILHAMGEHWLAEYSLALDEIFLWDIEGMTLGDFSNSTLERILAVYKNQKGILPLVQVMSALPELRGLDDAHDKLIVNCMTTMLRRLGFKQDKRELGRISGVWLEVTHALLLSITNQRGEQARRTMEDAQLIVLHLLETHLD